MNLQSLPIDEQQLGYLDLLNNSVGGMTHHARRVAAFMLKSGQQTLCVPTMPDSSVRRLRCLLLLEETLEFIHAAGFEVDLHTEFSPPCRVGERFGYSLFETGGEPSYEGMVDACADVSVVNTGTLIAMGAGDVNVLQAVDIANLEKVSGPVTYDENWKIKKPDGWKKPVYRCVGEFERLRNATAPASPVVDDFGEGILGPYSES